MSEQSAERDEPDGPLSVPDEELPEDLRPGEDNPLAQPAGDDVPDDVLEESADDSDQEAQESQDPQDPQGSADTRADSGSDES